MNRAFEISRSILTQGACCPEPFDIQSRMETFSKEKIENLITKFLEKLKTRLTDVTFKNQKVINEIITQFLIQDICYECGGGLEGTFEYNIMALADIQKYHFSLSDYNTYGSIFGRMRAEVEMNTYVYILENLRAWEDPDILLDELRKDNEDKKNANPNILRNPHPWLNRLEIEQQKLIKIEQEKLKCIIFNHVTENINDDVKQKLIDNVKIYNDALSAKVETLKKFDQIDSVDLLKSILDGDKDYSLELEFDWKESIKNGEIVFAIIEKNGIQEISRTLISESEL
jgi:hypothetical protein